MLKNTPTNKIIIGFVGDLASGKGTACKYLKEKHGAEVYRFSTILRDILNRVYVEISRANLQKISTAIRETFGQDAMSHAIAKDISGGTNEIMAVDGIRRPSDIVGMEKFPGFHLVYLTAEPKIRWQRLTKRNENEGDDKKILEEFLRDEQAEADRLIKDIGKKAEFTIVNDGTFEELYRQIEDILGKNKNEKG